MKSNLEKQAIPAIGMMLPSILSWLGRMAASRAAAPAMSGLMRGVLGRAGGGLGGAGKYLARSPKSLNFANNAVLGSGFGAALAPEGERMSSALTNALMFGGFGLIGRAPGATKFMRPKMPTGLPAPKPYTYASGASISPGPSSGLKSVTPG